MNLLHDGKTTTGRRDNNEDGLFALPERGLYAVADGMGGYEGGEVASRVALASLQSYFELLGDGGLPLHSVAEAEERMGLAIRIAHREIARRAVGELSEMGTTIACLAFDAASSRAMIAHVGDSRVYRLRGEILTPLTRDHSLYAQMEAAGVEWLPRRSAFPMSNVITQALGQGATVHPDLRVIDVEPGDRFLLCTDGLSDVLHDPAIAAYMKRDEDVCDDLVVAAFRRGSHDNITALFVQAD